MIKIYGSTEAPNREVVLEWLQLEVINQWDFKTSPICFKDNIPYSIHKCTVVSYRRCKITPVLNLTKEIKEELIRMGYILNKKLTEN